VVRNGGTARNFGSHARQSLNQNLSAAFHEVGLKAARTRAEAQPRRGGIIAPVRRSHSAGAVARNGGLRSRSSERVVLPHVAVRNLSRSSDHPGVDFAEAFGFPYQRVLPFRPLPPKSTCCFPQAPVSLSAGPIATQKACAVRQRRRSAAPPANFCWSCGSQRGKGPASALAYVP
jgi:hypothetical protein